MNAAVHCYPGYAAPAERLAAALALPCRPIALRHFPDGESLVRVAESGAIALIYCPLDNPDAKLVHLLLAASALRDGGARQVVLVAPYLGYMRQDRAFSPGEPVSQRVVGRLLASTFDALVTVDPHLHRTPSLELVVPGIACANVSAAPTIAMAMADRLAPDTILVGPDAESRGWLQALAIPMGLDWIVGEKRRIADRKVEIGFLDAARVQGKPVLLVDDMISSGGTLLQCTAELRQAGATVTGAVATHCLASEADLAALAHSIGPILATDTIPGPVATIAMAAALADAISQLPFMTNRL